ncbi:glycosyltransferase family 2 protein [Sphingomonas sp. RS6]
MIASPPPEVSILVVAFRSASFIERCIEGIRAAAADTPHEILLIDNGDDGTETLVRTRFPDVQIVPSEGNIGFGAGNNRCAAQARAPRLLLINPDAIPQPGAIDALIAFAQSTPDAAAWGGRSLSTDGRLDTANFLSLPRVRDFVKGPIDSLRGLARGGLPADATQPGPADVLNGGFMMIRADVWRALGGFDESFFLYSEEIDLFRRLKDCGERVLVHPDVAVIHDAGGGQAISASRFLYRTTGQMHYARKHFSRTGALVTGASLWLVAAKYAIGAPIAAMVMPNRRLRLMALGAAWRAVCLSPGRWWRGYADR